MLNTAVWGHRGASAYSGENTLEAFALAAAQGADGVELDVHLSKDGHVVIAHDEQLERVSNGTGRINDYTLSELRELNFNKLFPEKPPCSIPTLGEVYELFKGTDMTVNVELKAAGMPYAGMPEKLIALEREYDMGERVLYSSFNHYALIELKQRRPGVKTGLLYGIGLIDPWVYARYAGAFAIHPHYSIIAALPETVTKCHQEGIAVNVWTADDPSMLELMFRLGVDAVMTNTPDVALKIREKAGG